MESTGENWKPIFNILEHSFEILLVNAQHIKTVPGHKADVKDAEWIAEWLRFGLLKASFVAPLVFFILRMNAMYSIVAHPQTPASVPKFQGLCSKILEVISKTH
jgi:hypothetical protein